MRVGILGPMGSGKTTAANYLVNRHGFNKVSLAAPVKAVDSIINEPEEYWRGALSGWAIQLLPDPIYFGLSTHASLVDLWIRDFKESKSRRERLQRVGTDSGRFINDEIWINYMRRYLPDGDIVIDDVRFKNEVEALRDLSFVIVRLDIDEDIRRNRLEERDGFFDASVQGHSSETELEGIKAHLNISNNDNADALEDNLDRLITDYTLVKDGYVAI